jgi:Flp pilus assembly CpaF family ATPase
MNEIENFIFNKFKEQFKTVIKKTLECNFDSILNDVLLANNLDKSDVTNISKLKEWYNYSFNNSYILKIPNIENCYEAIIHSSQFIDIITKGKRNKLSVEFLDQEDLQISLEILARKHGIEWNLQKPFASFKAKIGHLHFRTTLIHKSMTETEVSKAFFRSSKVESMSLDSFSLNENIITQLKQLVSEKKNIVVAGATSSGKTTFLRSLTGLVDNNEHIVVIEDTHEIPGPQQSYTHLISKKVSGKSMTDYCEYALRISPDRIILGEIRSCEVIPYILAMNTGHKGLMTTIHANSASDTLIRFATLFSLFSVAANAINFNQVLSMICQNVDYVVYLEDKSVKEIIEVLGSELDKPIYRKVNLSKLQQIEEPQYSFARAG